MKYLVKDYFEQNDDNLLQILSLLNGFVMNFKTNTFESKKIKLIVVESAVTFVI